MTGLALDPAFIVGAIVSATDPVSVIATFKRLGAPTRLATLVEAESLFNDGTAARPVRDRGRRRPRAHGCRRRGRRFTGTVVSVPAIGSSPAWSRRASWRAEDHLIELTISVVLAYGTYLLADQIGLSGVIATVVAGDRPR